MAADQRPPLYQLVAGARPDLGERGVWREVARLKALVVQALAPLATGVLLDPLWGREALAHLPRRAALLLALEDHRFGEDPQGFRKSRLIPGWSVARAVREGADALKLLLWYRPDAPEEVRAHQEALVRRVGAACRRAGRPFVLEILPYPVRGEEISWELLEGALRRLADPGLGVDLYKLPYFPGRMGRYTELLPAPWVLLSGRLGMEGFLEALAEALEAGAKGFLAGRAFWMEALSAYPDGEAVWERLLASREGFKRGLGLLGGGG